MRCQLCLVASLASGCSFTINRVSGGGDDTTPIDAARVDVVEFDAPAECSMWKPHNFVACSIPAPSGELDLTAGVWTFSTDSGALTDPTNVVTTPANKPITQTDGSTAYLISIASLNVEPGATLLVTGAEPLIVASWDTITVAGTIDVGSSGVRVGAGSSPQPQCRTTPWSTTAGTTAMLGQDEVPTTGGSGGGGGGALDGNGGAGGTGDNPQSAVGGFGGVAISAPAIVRGGCSGANSGKAGPGDTAGDPNAISVGGAGGGAIELAARTAVAITGMVLAGGGGGGGCPLGSASGGGGGGAGGLLAFDSPGIAFTGATIAANGGGGGASGGFAETGNGGQDGQPSAVRAAGGAAPASACAEAGQLGGAGNTPNGASSANTVFACGGSGGGGGVGFVLTWGTVTKAAATISPVDMPGPS